MADIKFHSEESMTYQASARKHSQNQGFPTWMWLIVGLIVILGLYLFIQSQLQTPAAEEESSSAGAAELQTITTDNIKKGITGSWRLSLTEGVILERHCSNALPDSGINNFFIWKVPGFEDQIKMRMKCSDKVNPTNLIPIIKRFIANLKDFDEFIPIRETLKRVLEQLIKDITP